MSTDYQKLRDTYPELQVYELTEPELYQYVTQIGAGLASRQMAEGLLDGKTPDYRLGTNGVMEVYRLARELGYPDSKDSRVVDAAAQYLDYLMVFVHDAYAELSENDIDWSRTYGEHVPAEVTWLPMRALKAANRGVEFATNMRKVRSVSKKYFDIGAQEVDGSYPGLEWYNGMFQWFIDVFQDEGDAKIFLNLLAATSPQERVKNNLALAIRCYQYWKAKKPIPKAEPGRPGLMTIHYVNVIRVINGEELSSPKIVSFVRNMLGSEWDVTVDTWTIKALGTDEVRPFRWLNAIGFPLVDVVPYDIVKAEIIKKTGKTPTGKEIAAKLGFKTTSALQKYKTTWQVPNIQVGGKVGKTGDLPHRYATVAAILREAARKVKDPRPGKKPTPREFQAAIWTGIKMERDPVGLSDFRTYYEQLFGKRPPESLDLERPWSKTWPPPELKEEAKRREEQDAKDKMYQYVSGLLTDSNLPVSEAAVVHS